MTCSKNVKFGLLLLLIVFGLRVWTFYNPIVDVDEPQFAGFAHVLLNGGIPYVEAFDTKPIGIYAFFTLIFWIFGANNMIAVHVATALVVFFTAIYCFRIASKIYSEKVGMIAALLYAVFTTAYIPKFIGTSIAIVMMLPLTASIYYLVKWDESQKYRDAFIAGLLWGIACLFKYQAGINLVVVFVYMIIRLSFPRKRESSLLTGSPLKARGDDNTTILSFLTYLLGGITVGATFALYLKSIGAWDAFWFWSISGSATYVAAASKMSDFWGGLLVRGGTLIASSLLIWYLAAREIVSIVLNILKRQSSARSTEYLIVIWLFLSIIPVCTGGKFYGHYFLQMYPALCVLAAARSVSFLEVKFYRVLFILGIVIPMVGFFTARFFADDIYKSIHEENPKTYVPVADYIKQNTKIDDRIFVWGFATSIYTYADRLPATRFLWCDQLTGRVSGTPSAKDPNFDTTDFIIPGSWDMLFDDLKKHPPAYFVDSSPGNHHDYGKYPISKYPLLEKYLRDNFVFETSINGMNVYKNVRHSRGSIRQRRISLWLKRESRSDRDPRFRGDDNH